MPTLQFKGKSLVWNHHLSVPFHTLDDVNELDYQAEKGNGNLIVEGDNLIALKALIPEYQGKIKCIYIDPPYNTGNESWVYNDKVNSPIINEWLGQVVGSDDLSKHDKWLCMMVPRLKLLKELLSEDGVIFISIDDNEVHHLRQIMNEMFGEENFVAEIIWNRKRGRDNSAKWFSKSHEYLIVFSKDKTKFETNYLSLEEETIKAYKNQDSDIRGDYRMLATWARGTQGGVKYSFTNKEGQFFSERLWLFSKENLIKMDNENRLIFKGDNIYRKLFITENKGKIPETIWNKVSNAANASDEIKLLFGNIVFDTPKPTPYIIEILNICTSDNDIILDSFAGSGTTMHAVMALNKEDGGNRKCIMIQMPENNENEPEKNIAKDITRERVKRAIDKFEFDSGFSYKRVGVKIRAEEFFAGNLPEYKQFAEYVYYLATGKLDKSEINIDKSLFYVGGNSKEDVYLIYEKDNEVNERLALNLSLVNKMLLKSGQKKKIVYAPVCYLDDEYMTEYNFEFVNVPFNLFEKTV